MIHASVSRTVPESQIFSKKENTQMGNFREFVNSRVNRKIIIIEIIKYKYIYILLYFLLFHIFTYAFVSA